MICNCIICDSGIIGSICIGVFMDEAFLEEYKSQNTHRNGRISYIKDRLKKYEILIAHERHPAV